MGVRERRNKELEERMEGDRMKGREGREGENNWDKELERMEKG